MKGNFMKIILAMLLLGSIASAQTVQETRGDFDASNFVGVYRKQSGTCVEELNKEDVSDEDLLVTVKSLSQNDLRITGKDLHVLFVDLDKPYVAKYHLADVEGIDSQEVYKKVSANKIEEGHSGKGLQMWVIPRFMSKSESLTKNQNGTLTYKNTRSSPGYDCEMVPVESDYYSN
jgi:hypothetical protein